MIFFFPQNGSGQISSKADKNTGNDSRTTRLGKSFEASGIGAGVTARLALRSSGRQLRTRVHLGSTPSSLRPAGLLPSSTPHASERLLYRLT